MLYTSHPSLVWWGVSRISGVRGSIPLSEGRSSILTRHLNRLDSNRKQPDLSLLLICGQVRQFQSESVAAQ